MKNKQSKFNLKNRGHIPDTMDTCTKEDTPFLHIEHNKNYICIFVSHLSLLLICTTIYQSAKVFLKFKINLFYIDKKYKCYKTVTQCKTYNSILKWVCPIQIHIWCSKNLLDVFRFKKFNFCSNKFNVIKYLHFYYTGQDVPH
jgi:hypothetical protein